MHRADAYGQTKELRTETWGTPRFRALEDEEKQSKERKDGRGSRRTKREWVLA